MADEQDDDCLRRILIETKIKKLTKKESGFLAFGRNSVLCLQI